MKPHNNYYKHQKFFKFLDKFNIRPWHWIFISVIVACADFLSGANIHFPILYLLPIALAGWSGKRSHALVLAIVLPCLKLIFHMIWNLPWLAIDTIADVIIRIGVFLIFAYLISFTKELRIFKGLLNVCSYCGRIKNDGNNWIPLQEYIINHSEAMLNHGICPDRGIRLIENKNGLTKLLL